MTADEGRRLTAARRQAGARRGLLEGWSGRKKGQAAPRPRRRARLKGGEVAKETRAVEVPADLRPALQADPARRSSCRGSCRRRSRDRRAHRDRRVCGPFWGEASFRLPLLAPPAELVA